MANKKPSIRSKQDIWTDEQIENLIEIFPTTDNLIIEDKIGKSLKAVRSKATTLGLKKSGRYWSRKQELWLVENYISLSNEKLVVAFEKKFHVKRTMWALINKYRELKLRSPER